MAENSLLVAAATTKEIAPFLAWWKKEGLHSGSWNADLLITGIGLTASTYHFTRQLALKKYQLVIQAGVAGCFDLKIPLGTVLQVVRDTIADQSVVELNQLKTLFDLRLVPHRQFPYKNDWLVNPHRPWIKKAGLPVVNGISVNEISSDRRKIGFYREKFNPCTESMEGAALHYCCLMEGVPFLQLRSISNYIGERNKSKWNMGDSIAGLNESLIKLLLSL
jgi:futalosine hydrolase